MTSSSKAAVQHEHRVRFRTSPAPGQRCIIPSRQRSALQLIRWRRPGVTIQTPCTKGGGGWRGYLGTRSRRTRRSRRGISSTWTGTTTTQGKSGNPPPLAVAQRRIRQTAQFHKTRSPCSSVDDCGVFSLAACGHAVLDRSTAAPWRRRCGPGAGD